ncbi:MAG: BlaI/MecI/CopY family transcriptional regulator [Planctomycetaceae bacterium]
MARPPSTQPTDGELELLKLLWETGPCTLGRLCAALRQSRPVATTTVATMLSVMRNKGLVKRVRGNRAYLWSARVRRDETNRRLVDRLIERAFDGSAQLLVAHLVESNKLSDSERRQVLALFEKGAGRARGPRSTAESGRGRTDRTEGDRR